MDYDAQIKEYEAKLADLKKKRHDELQKEALTKRETMPESVKEYLMKTLKHVSSYCSDDDPNNAFVRQDKDGNEYWCFRCPKCAFIKLMNGSLGNDFTFDINVSVYPV